MIAVLYAFYNKKSQKFTQISMAQWVAGMQRSADMLEDIKVPWVILGHSERRSLLKESEEVRQLPGPLHCTS